MGFFGKILGGLGKAIIGDPFGFISAASSLTGAVSQAGITKRDYKYQKKLMAYQDKLGDENYAKQLHDQRVLIDEDRQYNSIGAQMQRARNANISPLAALGVSGGSSIGASSPSQSTPTPTAPRPDSISQFASSLSGAFMQIAQMNMLQKQMKQVEAETSQTELENVKQRFDNIIAEIEANGFQEKYNILVNELRQDLRDATSKANISDTEYKFLLDSYDERLAAVRKQNLKTDAEANLANEQAQTDKELRQYRKDDLSASVALKKAEKVLADYHGQHFHKYGEDIPSGGINGVISRLVNLVFGETNVGHDKEFGDFDTSTPKSRWETFWSFGNKLGLAPGLLAALSAALFGD